MSLCELRAYLCALCGYKYFTTKKRQEGTKHKKIKNETNMIRLTTLGLIKI